MKQRWLLLLNIDMEKLLITAKYYGDWKALDGKQKMYMEWGLMYMMLHHLSNQLVFCIFLYPSERAVALSM